MGDRHDGRPARWETDTMGDRCDGRQEQENKNAGKGHLFHSILLRWTLMLGPVSMPRFMVE